MVQALTQEQKLFLQRIMAVKVMTDEEAKGLYKEIMTLTQGRGASSTAVDGFDKFVGQISSHLKEYFDLDVRTAVIFHEAPVPSMSTTTKYHAFVNRVNDKPAELYGAFNKSPHEIALFKIILERLVERGNEKDDDDEDNDEGDSTSNERRAAKAKKNTSPVTGCSGSLSIMDMLSLRSELTEAHEGKLTLQQTQGAIDKFIQEKWLAPEIGSKQDINSDSRSSSASTSSAEDYESTTATSYQIGPRTYMDLDMLLRDLGLRNLPQFISLVATLQPL